METGILDLFEESNGKISWWVGCEMRGSRCVQGLGGRSCGEKAYLVCRVPSSPAQHKQGMAVHTYNPSKREVEKGR